MLLGLCWVMGVVWGIGMGDFDMVKLCLVVWLVDVLLLLFEMIEFLEWMVEYILMLLFLMLWMVMCVFDLD